MDKNINKKISISVKTKSVSSELGDQLIRLQFSECSTHPCSRLLLTLARFNMATHQEQRQTSL